MSVRRTICWRGVRTPCYVRTFQHYSFLMPHSKNDELRQYSIPRKLDSAESDPYRIHVLGIGNIGRFFAHALANSPSLTPISLLLHRSSLLADWRQAGHKISITTNGATNSCGHFDVEDISSISSPSTPISNLIIATKTLHTVSALRSIAHRLSSESTVLFTQNGMGTVDEANALVFDNPSARPNYLTSLTSHGIFTTGPFSSVHAGQAFVSIGRSLQSPPASDSSKGQYLMNKVLEAPILAAKEYPAQEMVYLQLEKLVINAMLNPLTAIFDCRNGELFEKGTIIKLMRVLLQETAQVLQLLPEIQNSEDPHLEKRFSTQELELKVLDVAEKNAKNTSSMLQDVRAGKQTEIDYINGWIVNKGRELGIDCEHNAKLVEMVKTGTKIGIEDIGDSFPRPGDSNTL